MPFSNGAAPEVRDENGYQTVPTTNPEETQPTTTIAQNGRNDGGDGIVAVADEVANDAEVVVPPDGGWGWVIVAASFACNMIVDGIIFSFGMFIDPIAQSFGAGKAQIALVGSLMSGFYLMTGPFASALANRYGFRLVAILGSILGVSAFVLSHFSTSVPYLYLSYGVLGGIGFGLIYVPAVITVGFYFERLRALATGIGVCGSGIGTFLFAPISSSLIATMGWKNTLLVQGAIVATCAFFGALFRPLKPTKVKDLENAEKKPELVMDSRLLPPQTRVKMENALKHIANSHHSLTRSQTTINKIMGANNNADYPTIADVYHTITATSSHAKPTIPSMTEKRLSVPFLKENDRPLLTSKGSTPIIVPPRRPSHHRARTNSEVGGHPRSRRGTLTEVNRPLYRDDIFFAGSVARLPQYQSQGSLAYNMSVTRLPTKADIEEEATHTCSLCPEAMRRTLATMLDMSLLRSPSFILLALSGFFTMMGFYVPFMYITDRAVKAQWTDTQWLVSSIGITNTIGRVLCGMLSFFPKIDTLLVNNVAISVGGIATMLSGISMSAEYQYFYACVFGLAISCFASLRSILVVELLGLEKLTNAFGLLLLFQGAAAAVGAPIAGAFMDATGSYDASFYLSGGLIFFSAVLCYPLNRINAWEKKRADANANQKSVPI